MDKIKRDQWLDKSLNVLLEVFAKDEAIKNILTFKGARILRYYLGDKSRFSMDIDSSLSFNFVSTHKIKAEQVAFLENAFSSALSKYFLSQDIIKYKLGNLKIKANPPEKEHPYGWDGFKVTINLLDVALQSVRGIPRIEIDIAYPEKLTEHSIKRIEIIKDCYIKAYSLERIAGEKPRAFLSTLPAYFKKMGKTSRSVRAKDLYDIAKILEVRNIDNREFWLTAGNEFREACKSRYIDCEGIKTFTENVNITELTYRKDPTIPKDVSFMKAWESLEIIVRFWESNRILPLG